jgi:hypothetical protein
MGSTDLVLRMIRLLNELAIPYMLVGSYSSNYYGRPRSTKDADFVVALQGDQLAHIQQALGGEFRIDPQMAFETVTMHTRHLIVHPASAFQIELFLLTDEPYNQARFGRRLQVEFEGITAWLPSPEDVIVQKLLWSQSANRDQDVTDAAGVIRVQKRLGLDLAYIRLWTDKHGTRELFERLLAG